MPFYAITKKNGWIIVHRILNCIQKVCWWYFVLFSSKEHLQLFVDYMNKQHRCIKFTSKTEQNNTFSLLDINITRQNNQLKTSVYRKPTFSGVFTHYESYIDQSYKKSLIFIIAVILFDRTTHCSIWKLKS